MKLGASRLTPGPIFLFTGLFCLQSARNETVTLEFYPSLRCVSWGLLPETLPVNDWPCHRIEV
jgi:hypothetical protein